LYVIHGMLHLVGYRDKTPSDAQAMRAAEERYLRQFGIERPAASAAGRTDDSLLAASGNEQSGEP
jgi:probable rRNA maturation factor